MALLGLSRLGQHRHFQHPDLKGPTFSRLTEGKVPSVQAAVSRESRHVHFVLRGELITALSRQRRKEKRM